MERPWFLAGNQADCDSLCDLLTLVQSNDMLVVEVGSYHGGSAVVIGQTIKGYGRLVCIEVNSVGCHYTHDVVKTRELDKTVVIRNAESVVASETFEDESITLVYLDANHVYPSIREDLRCWWPKVKQNGILCGHDCQFLVSTLLPNQRTLLRAWATCERCNKTALGDLPEYVKWWDYPNIHPGVILAVWEFFGDRASLVRPGSSIWYVRK
jgi:predicted O-methyltransferase YrrM